MPVDLLRVLTMTRTSVLSRIPEAYGDFRRGQLDWGPGSRLALFERDIALWHSVTFGQQTMSPGAIQGGEFSFDQNISNQLISFRFNSGPLPFKGKWCIEQLGFSEAISREEISEEVSYNNSRIFDQLPNLFVISYFRSWARLYEVFLLDEKDAILDLPKSLDYTFIDAPPVNFPIPKTPQQWGLKEQMEAELRASDAQQFLIEQLKQELAALVGSRQKPTSRDISITSPFRTRLIELE